MNGGWQPDAALRHIYAVDAKTQQGNRKISMHRTHIGAPELGGPARGALRFPTDPPG